MIRHLPDVNVLFALVWRRHEHHAAAHAWFESAGRRAWATNALIQLGVLRLLTNPAITLGAVSAAGAVEAVREATQHSGHEFWPLDRQMPDSLARIAGRVHGYRQWTDAALVAHAADRGGALVTFDTGMREVAGDISADHVIILSGTRSRQIRKR